MMARDKMEEMNKARDMISTITDIALKQRATVENTFLCLADNEALIAKMIRAEREMLCTTRAKNITSAECLDMTKLRTIHRQQVSTDDERNALSRAYACATFGEEGIKSMDAIHFTDMHLQAKYRTVCALANPAMSIPEIIHARLTREQDITDLVGAKNSQMVQLILYEMLIAYGFSGPFDTSTVEVSPQEYVVLWDKLLALCSQLKKLTSGRGLAPENPFRAASAYLSSNWHITPSNKQHTKMYTLTSCKPKWPEQYWENHKRYAVFIDDLKAPRVD